MLLLYNPVLDTLTYLKASQLSRNEGVRSGSRAYCFVLGRAAVEHEELGQLLAQGLELGEGAHAGLGVHPCGLAQPFLQSVADTLHDSQHLEYGVWRQQNL
ncbi:hypothetical protein MRX96_034114 [Rhipicephalus microplus]